MESNEPRIFPQGLCENCFWRYECGFAVDNPNEYVRNCDDDGGLHYMLDPAIKREQELERAGRLHAYIARDARGVCRIYCKRAKYKHWFELGRHADTDAAFEQALAAGTVCWNPGIVDRSKLF